MGIGSTMLASMNQGMKGIGFDLSKDFCGIAKDRIGKFQGTLTSEFEILNPDIYNKDSRTISKSRCGCRFQSTWFYKSIYAKHTKCWGCR
jgi:hypothetical protein